jgi:hypothetical protein
VQDGDEEDMGLQELQRILDPQPLVPRGTKASLKQDCSRQMTRTCQEEWLPLQSEASALIEKILANQCARPSS